MCFLLFRHSGCCLLTHLGDVFAVERGCILVSTYKKSGCRYSNRYCFVPTDHRKQLLTIQTIIH